MREICDEFFPDIPSFSTEDIFVSHHSLRLYFLLIYSSIYKAFSERISPFLHNRAANSDGLLCNVNFDEIYCFYFLEFLDDNNFQEDSVNNSQFFTCRSSFPVDYSLDCSKDISSLSIKESLNLEAINEVEGIEESAVSQIHDQNDIKLENSKDFVQPQKRVSSKEEQGGRELPILQRSLSLVKKSK
ncbi:uncharacterized protein LOC118760932 [Octopus sinensis]|uniref:Uncharacterized protein LOC118760932 n=1 Tax=Octopus sinensis TaxID=2607531 RepID=A0A7E6EFW6_9MOLL|nr:uncharacterized protein LOC118760932 [Octopus sinensis]